LRDKIDNLEFDIVSEAEDIIINQMDANFHENDFKHFAKDNMEDSTIGGFARDLQDFVTVNKITERGRLDMLILMEKYFGKRYNIPLSKSKRNGKLVYRSLLKQFTRQSRRSLTFDVCRNYCSVYVGQYADKKHCHICKEARYSKCNKNKCAKNLSGVDNCQHSTKYRTPMKTINYHCILPLFCALAENEYFKKCINYTHIKDQSYQYSDISDGACYKRNLQAMKSRYATVAKNKAPLKIEEFNINIAINYDGVQIYKHKCGTFNPLLMTILNLPPSFRSKVGVGMFLVSLFTLQEKSETEYFIFHKCLLKELEALQFGYLHQVGTRSILIQVILF
jgi:hypothetical protein